MKSNDSTALIAYVPAPHKGYLQLFRKYRGAILFLLGNDFIADFRPLVRHLPANDPEEVRLMLWGLDLFAEIHVLSRKSLPEVRGYASIVMPEEDVSQAFAAEHLQDILPRVRFDGGWKLRWDWGATQLCRRPSGEDVITIDELHRVLMCSAHEQARRSPDWWRQIGALLVREGQVLIAGYNQHMPHEQSAYLQGDPRSNFEQGAQIEVSSALHAEPGVIAEAARRGIGTAGCDLYVTTFPCPPCAYLVAHTGIHRLFYADGYSLIAGAETLQAKGVEIIRVSM